MNILERIQEQSKELAEEIEFFKSIRDNMSLYENDDWVEIDAIIDRKRQVLALNRIYETLQSKNKIG